MYPQRKRNPRSFDLRTPPRLWTPEIKLQEKKIRLEAKASDWYVVVDDLDEDTVVVEAARWPQLDEGSRLRFDGIDTHSYSLQALQKAVNRARTLHGQLAPDRRLRVGDAFWVRSRGWPGDRLLRLKKTLIDITEPAREQAKTAFYGAATQTLDPRQARKRTRSAPMKKPRRPRRPRVPGAIAEPEV